MVGEVCALLNAILVTLIFFIVDDDNDTESVKITSLLTTLASFM